MVGKEYVMPTLYQENPETRSAALTPETIQARYPQYRVTYSDVMTVPPDNGVYAGFYPVPLWGGGEVRFPFRDLNPDTGISLLMTTQLPNKLLPLLSERMVQRLGYYERVTGIHVDTIAGIAKLGNGPAQRISEILEFEDWTPLDTGRKLWYSEELSEPISSVTSADSDKRIWLDPHIWTRILGKTVLVVDDAINTAGSMRGAVRLLRKAGAKHIVLAPLLTEGHDWEPVFDHPEVKFPWQRDLICLGHIPVFTPIGDGKYIPISGTE